MCGKRFEGWDPEGTPEFFRARKATQYSGSIDDDVRIMTTGNNGGYANDWLVGDNRTGEIARFELGLKKWTVERDGSEPPSPGGDGPPRAPDFEAEPFLARPPEFGWMRTLLRDMPTGPWTEFRTGMTRPASQP